MRLIIFVAVSLLAAIIPVHASGPAFTGDFKHPTNGLTITIPEAFEANAAQPVDGAAVRMRRDWDAWCTIIFSKKEANAAFPQDQVNASLSAIIDSKGSSDPKHRGQKLISITREDKAGIAGFAILSDYPRPDTSRSGQIRRGLMFLWDTPQGRTMLHCVAPKVRFGGLRKDFEALANGVTPPR